MKVGTLFRFHPKPEWGVGVVVALARDGSLDVVFEKHQRTNIPWPANADKVDVVAADEVPSDSPLLEPARWRELDVALTRVAAPVRRKERAESAEPCGQCRAPLKESIRSRTDDWKSCPSCSADNGEVHVFLPYPDAFGQSDKRVSLETPDGAQSWCEACRWKKPLAHEQRLCAQIEK